MSPPLGGIGVERFLSEFWQRKPCLLRQAFPDFEPDLDADDVAGLACEEMAEARLVTGSFTDRDWTLRHGPFSEEDFAALGQRNWTLLVQDAEKHYPPLRRLLAAFDFIPAWRIDDLMISVAGPGGSVGPHVDQYDVFLLQAAGRRNWQVAESFDPDLLPHCELNVLVSFEAEREWVLEPGDMLYLPPNVAHHGVALDPGMTWSVGLRAPSTADILLGLGEWMAAERAEGNRYTDPTLDLPIRAGEIPADAADRFAALLRSAAENTDDFRRFLGAYLSRYRMALGPAPPETAFDDDALARALRRGAQLRRNPWTRLAWISTGSNALLFAAGDEYRCTPGLAERLCQEPEPDIEYSNLGAAQFSVIRELLNGGHLFLSSD